MDNFNIPRPPGELSVPALLFYEHQAKKISTKDYHVQTSVWVSENSKEYPVRVYPTMSPVIRSYCQSRINTVISYDKTLAIKLGEWMFQMIRLMELNQGDVDLLLWCREKLVLVELTKKIEMIDRQIDRFQSNPNYQNDFSLAAKTKELDAREKQSA